MITATVQIKLIVVTKTEPALVNLDTQEKCVEIAIRLTDIFCLMWSMEKGYANVSYDYIYYASEFIIKASGIIFLTFF